MVNRRGEMETMADFILLDSKITVDGEYSHEIKSHLLHERITMKNLDSKGKRQKQRQRHHFPDKGPHNESYGFISNHVQMWELDHKEDREPKNWCFQIVVLEKTLENPQDSKIKPVNPKGNQSWILTGSTYAKVQATVFWPCSLAGTVNRVTKSRTWFSDWTTTTQAIKNRKKDKDIFSHVSTRWLERDLFCCLLTVHSGFPDSSGGKDSAWSAGDPGLIPGSGRSAGDGIGHPL